MARRRPNIPKAVCVQAAGLSAFSISVRRSSENGGSWRCCRDAHGEAADLLDLDQPLLGDPQAANVIALPLNGRLDLVADLENSFSALAPSSESKRRVSQSRCLEQATRACHCDRHQTLFVPAVRKVNMKYVSVVSMDELSMSLVSRMATRVVNLQRPRFLAHRVRGLERTDASPIHRPTGRA